MTQRLLLGLLIVLCVSILPVFDALACQCYINTPEVDFAQSDAVFIGTVLLITPTSNPDFLDVLVSVSGFWKGIGIGLTHLYTYAAEPACGYVFQVGEVYLVFASEVHEDCCEGLMTSVCVRTKPLSNAGEELAYLGPPGTVPVDNVTWGLVKTAYE
jgi:hypothetical protein